MLEKRRLWVQIPNYNLECRVGQEYRSRIKRFAQTPSRDMTTLTGYDMIALVLIYITF